MRFIPVRGHDMGIEIFGSLSGHLHKDIMTLHSFELGRMVLEY